mgnify:CR=1 FL=1
METIKVAIRITEEIRIKLEEYIVINGLHRQRIRYNQLAEQIIKDWLKNPRLNKEKIIKRIRNLTIKTRTRIRSIRKRKKHQDLVPLLNQNQ